MRSRPSSQRRNEQARLRSARGWGAGQDVVRWFASFSSGSTFPRWSTPTRSSTSNRFERARSTVLTPHAGELARLLDTDAEWVDAHRLEAAQRGAERFGAVLVLKGSDTIVAAPGSGVIVCDLGPPALATAGTGDVLDGYHGRISRQGPRARSSRPRRPQSHTVVRRTLAPHRAGLVASDLLDALPRALEG